MMHLAVQYLAAAGISFVAKKDDDSHTNVGFSIEKTCMETHPISENGDILSLDYKYFSLNWNSKSGSISFPLDGATHADILNWLKETSKTFINKSYSYEFHYDLPYEMTDDFKFKLVDANRLEDFRLSVPASRVFSFFEGVFSYRGQTLRACQPPCSC